MSRITFKKLPVRDGRARRPEMFSVNREGKQIATIQRLGDSHDWFWYGDGVNTASNPMPLADVKSDVVNHFSKEPA